MNLYIYVCFSVCANNKFPIESDSELGAPTLMRTSTITTTAAAAAHNQKKRIQVRKE